MKTRTLLLLSVGTALAILMAGGVFLLQLAAQDDAADLASIGDPAQVGDVIVTVLSADEAGGIMAVDVEIGGIDVQINAEGTVKARCIGTALLASLIALWIMARLHGIGVV